MKELWLTHGHWDHLQDAAKVVRETTAKVRAHADDRILFEKPAIMEERMGRRLGLEPVKVDHWVGQGERLSAPPVMKKVGAAAYGVVEPRTLPLP